MNDIPVTGGIQRSAMARLTFGQLSNAWLGEAADFTPLLGQQLDALGDAIGVNLAAIGQIEVASAGGRRIDIVAEGDDGSEFVIENQFGRADHDHLTRGLAYAVARHARGLVIVAEEHRDEFRAVAQYLNEVAEGAEIGIAVWLVEAKAVRIEDSAWAPLFSVVVEPNKFTRTVEVAKKAERAGSPEEFLALCASQDIREAAEAVMARWRVDRHFLRFAPSSVVLEARGPSVGGRRTVVVVYADGRVLVPFHSFAGSNTGIPVEALMTPAFRQDADRLFGFTGTEKQAGTTPAWLNTERVPSLMAFCGTVATAYRDALAEHSQLHSASRVTDDKP